jgi:hypothetical protein
MNGDDTSEAQALADQVQKAKTVGDVAKLSNVPFLPDVLGYQLRNCNAKVTEPLPKGRGRAVALTAAVTRDSGELLKNVSLCGARVNKATEKSADTIWVLYLDIDVNKGLGDIPVVKDFLSHGNADFAKIGHLQLLATTGELDDDITDAMNDAFKLVFPELFPKKLPELPYPGQKEKFAPGVHLIANYRLGGRDQPFLRVDITKK